MEAGWVVVVVVGVVGGGTDVPSVPHLSWLILSFRAPLLAPTSESI